MADLLIDNVIATALNRLAKAEMGWGKIHPKVIKELLNLSDLYLVVGKYELAKPIYWRILDIQTKLLGPKHIDNAETLLSLGEVHECSAELELAEQFYVAALWILDQQEDRYQSDTLGRLFLKLYGVYKLTGNQKKISEIEARLYGYLKRGYNSRPSKPVSAMAAVA